MNTKCLVCGEQRDNGFLGLGPCPNGHTIQEEIAVADRKEPDFNQEVNLHADTIAERFDSETR